MNANVNSARFSNVMHALSTNECTDNKVPTFVYRAVLKMSIQCHTKWQVPQGLIITSEILLLSGNEGYKLHAIFIVIFTLMELTPS